MHDFCYILLGPISIMMTGYSLVGQKAGPRTHQSFCLHLHLDAILDDQDIMPRTTPQNHELQPGCILWLPKKDEIDDDLLMDVHIGHGCFDHPVVVLSTNLVQGKATVFIVSTLIQSLRSHLVQLSANISAHFLQRPKPCGEISRKPLSTSTHSISTNLSQRCSP